MTRMEAITFLYKEAIKKMTRVRLLCFSPETPEDNVALRGMLRGKGSGRDFYVSGCLLKVQTAEIHPQ